MLNIFMLDTNGSVQRKCLCGYSMHVLHVDKLWPPTSTNGNETGYELGELVFDWVPWVTARFIPSLLCALMLFCCLVLTFVFHCSCSFHLRSINIKSYIPQHIQC